MVSERDRVGLLATWVGGQVKALTAKLAVLRNGSTGGLTPKIYTATGVTNATGAVSFALPAGFFAVLATASLAVVRDTTAPASATFVTVRTRTTGTVTGQVWESKTTAASLIVSSGSEGLEPSGSGITVDLIAIGY